MAVKFTMKKQESLFENIDDFDIQRSEWVDMPEYNNVVEEEPLITATFKFKTEEDYNKFKKLVQEFIYSGDKVFDGMQRYERKTTWYPHKEKSNKYSYIDEPKISNLHNK